MAPVVTLVSPQDGDTVFLPLTVQGTVSPPGAVFALWDDTTGMFLGAVQSDDSGNASLVVDSLLTPGPRWCQAEVLSAAAVAISFQIGVVQVVGLSIVLSDAAVGVTYGIAVDGAGVSVSSGTVEITAAADVTAPAIQAFTVQDTTGTSMTAIEAEATDAVGIVKWMIKEAATNSFTAPVSGDAGWTSITPTTSFHSHALTFTSSATQTGTRYFRFYACDSAGNVGASATSSCTITIASAVSVSDNFNRASLGSNWAAITNYSAGGIYNSTQFVGAGASTIGASRWSADTVANNQFAEAQLGSYDPGSHEDFTAYKDRGVIARASSSAQTFYLATMALTTDFENSYAEFALWKCVAGTFTQLGSTVEYQIPGGENPIIRIEANGTNIKLYRLATHGGTKTQVISVTDSAISSGSPGIWSGNNTYGVDNWYGGDL